MAWSSEAAYPDFPSGNLRRDIQEVITAAYWLEVVEVNNAFVCAEPGEVVDQIGKGVRDAHTCHQSVRVRLPRKRHSTGACA